MSTQADRGNAALQARNYVEAIQFYTEALKQSQSPVWLISRATAYQRTGAHELALQDAENAYHSAVTRAKRELMATAQFRRAIALHGLGRIGDARIALTWVRKLNSKEKGLGMWQERVANEFDTLPKDSEKRSVNVKEIPDKVAPSIAAPEKTANVSASKEAGKPQPVSVPAAPPAAQIAQKIRWEWFQNSTNISITIFAKGVSKDKVKFELDEYSLNIEFPTSSGSEFSLDVDLFSAVDQSKSTHNVTAYKIEVSLHKAVQGLKWATLEGSGRPDVAPVVAEAGKSSTASEDKPPVYPTSSRKPVKNWDAIADEEEEEGASADDFFKKLYRDADPDTKRAMMKSMEESNGTSLSTDWKDIGSRFVTPQPPAGVEEKKYGA